MSMRQGVRWMLWVMVAAVGVLVAGAGPLQAGASDAAGGVAQPPAFAEGEAVDLVGRVSGNWLTVLEGPRAQRQFELVKNQALAALRRQVGPGETVRVRGTALEYEGVNLILVTTFNRPAPASAPREGSGSNQQGGGARGGYREGS